MIGVKSATEIDNAEDQSKHHGYQEREFDERASAGSVVPSVGGKGLSYFREYSRKNASPVFTSHCDTRIMA